MIGGIIVTVLMIGATWLNVEIHQYGAASATALASIWMMFNLQTRMTQ